MNDALAGFALARIADTEDDAHRGYPDYDDDWEF